MYFVVHRGPKGSTVFKLNGTVSNPEFYVSERALFFTIIPFI